MKSFKEYKYDYGSPESVKLMKKITPGQKEAIDWSKAGTKAQIMHPITRVAKKVDKKDVRKYVDAGWLHMAQKKNRITKEAVYGNQAQRLSSPLQKMRQDKEKADRDKDGKLNMMKGRPKKEKVNELKKSTYANYINKASAQAVKHSDKAGYQSGKHEYDGNPDRETAAAKSADKADKRLAGIKRATKALSKEAMSPAEKAAHDKAIAAFKAKGGKIKKLKPGYAQGYHGKDDPGSGMRGMLDKGDSKAFGTRKKIKSMGEAINVNDAHTDAQNHSNGSMSVKKVQGKPSLIMKSYHSEKDGHAFAKKHGYKASNYVKTHAGSRMHLEGKDPGEYDEEGLMMKDQLDIVMDAADDIYDTVSDNENLPEWCQNKITKAADYIDSVRDYLKSQKTTNEGSGPSMGDLQKRANMKQSDKDKLLKIRQMLDKEKKNRPVK